MAEWLRNGVQNRVARFKSGRGLQPSLALVSTWVGLVFPSLRGVVRELVVVVCQSDHCDPRFLVVHVLGKRALGQACASLRLGRTNASHRLFFACAASPTALNCPFIPDFCDLTA